MDIETTFLMFQEKDGTVKLIAISDILYSGHPIEDDDEELELVDNKIYRGDGTVIN